MDALLGVSPICFGVLCLITVIKGQEQCNGELWCEQGHCCGSDGTHCCTYYYELWWFWMIWGLIIMLSCCCLYQQHRLKKRQSRALRALRTGLQDGSFVSLPAVGSDGRTSSPTIQPCYTGSEFRLPTYDEVQDLPKDPPAYEVLFEAGRSDLEPQGPPVSEDSEDIHVATDTSHPPLLPDVCHSSSCSQPLIIDSEDVGLLVNEAMQEQDLPPAYTAT